MRATPFKSRRLPKVGDVIKDPTPADWGDPVRHVVVESIDRRDLIRVNWKGNRYGRSARYFDF